MANNRRFGWHSGTMSCKDAKIQGDLTIQDTLIFGDVSFGELAVKGRMSSGSKAGTAIDIDANYSYGQGHEFRWTISSWAGTGNSFDGQYIRAQSDIDNASGTMHGIQVFSVANASGINDLQGAFVQAYLKGDSTDTVGQAYGMHGEFSMDASRSNTITLTTEVAAIFGRILSGKVNDYTKIHGQILRFGDMDGGSRTYGNGILIEDDAGTSGTSVLTTGLNISIACTTGISVTGAFTDGIKLDADGTTAINITSSFTGTTGLLLAGTATNGIDITGNCTSAINIGTGTFTSGVVLGGTLTNAIDLGACTSFVYSNDTVTNFLETDADSKGGAGVTRTTPNQTAVCDGSIVVKIGAKTLLIPIYNAVTIA